jgi:hypothetical protein
VQVLQRAEQLVHDVALVDVLEDVGAQHRVQVGLHVLEHEVDVTLILRLSDVQEPARARALGSCAGGHRGGGDRSICQAQGVKRPVCSRATMLQSGLVIVQHAQRGFT